jgi:hypothetical protein
MLLFELSGLFLLRSATRALFRLLFHDPPRKVPSASPRETTPRYRRVGFAFFIQPPRRLPISVT